MSTSPNPARHGKVVSSAFRPHPLIRNRHLQTALPALLRPAPDLRFRMETLETPDQDFVRLGWAGSDRADAPIAVLVHGLGGNLQSKYLCGLGQRLADLNWRVCALELRGAGPEPNRLARAYHHGDTHDLRQLWRLLRTRYPDCFVASIGWSLGGNVTLKALGEGTPFQDWPDFACAVSVPFRLKDCALHIRKGAARIYQAYLMKALRAMLRRKIAVTPIERPANLAVALAARDFFEFDNAYTAPANGFTSAEDYYAQASCAGYLRTIEVPTLIIQAMDDPFLPPSVLPDAPSLSASTILECAQFGGHVGFVGRDGPGFMAWLEQRICQALTTENDRWRQAAGSDPVQANGVRESAA